MSIPIVSCLSNGFTSLVFRLNINIVSLSYMYILKYKTNTCKESLHYQENIKISYAEISLWLLFLAETHHEHKQK